MNSIFKKFNTKILIILCLFLVLRLCGLGTDISNSDAARWHRRSEDFAKSLVSGRFAETYQSYHPGVTLMWAGSAARLIQKQINPCVLNDPTCYPLIHATSKTILVLFLGFLLLLQIILLRKLFGDKPALIYGFLISVEPYLVGIDRWWHLTSLETYSAFTAVLCLLVWYRFKTAKFLYFSAIFLGLSVLTKVSTLVILPVFLILLLSEKNRKYILSFIGIFILVLATLFPAVWVTPYVVIQKILGAIFGAVAEQDRLFYLPEIFKYVYYLVILLFKLSPITLALFILSVFRLGKNIKVETKVFLAIIFSYFIFYTVSAQKIDRYVISFVPYILFIISLFLSHLEAEYLIPALTFSGLFMGYVIFIYFPVFSSYYSPLLGGTRQALKIGVYDNSGEYFAQAAGYLNKKGGTLPVFVPNNIDSFSYFYNGETQRAFSKDTGYVLQSVSNERSSFPPSPCPKIDKSFGPQGTDVVRIYICK